MNNLLTDDSSQGIKSIILVPTRELSNQVFQFVEKLLTFSTNKINVLNLSSSYSDQVLNSLLVNKPEIIISTPAKLIQILEKNEKNIDLSTVKNLTIDEVDLVLSFGYLDDLKKLESYLPVKRICKHFNVSYCE